LERTLSGWLRSSISRSSTRLILLTCQIACPQERLRLSGSNGVNIPPSNTHSSFSHVHYSSAICLLLWNNKYEEK
jgi:hypothetical protein